MRGRHVARRFQRKVVDRCKGVGIQTAREGGAFGDVGRMRYFGMRSFARGRRADKFFDGGFF